MKALYFEVSVAEVDQGLRSLTVDLMGSLVRTDGFSVQTLFQQRMAQVVLDVG